jgi:hypothetical protein
LDEPPDREVAEDEIAAKVERDVQPLVFAYDSNERICSSMENFRTCRHALTKFFILSTIDSVCGSIDICFARIGQRAE